MTQPAEPREAFQPSDRLSARQWRVSVITLKDERWLVEADPQDTRASARVPPGGLLNRFCGLQNATPERIAQFAEQFGLLYLCFKHGLPQGHAPGCDARRLTEPEEHGEPIRECPEVPGAHPYGSLLALAERPSPSEDQITRTQSFDASIGAAIRERCDSVEDWRQWARRFKSTIALARAVQNRTDIDLEDVHGAFGGLASYFAGVFQGGTYTVPRYEPHLGAEVLVPVVVSDFQRTSRRAISRRRRGKALKRALWAQRKIPSARRRQQQAAEDQLSTLTEWLNTLLSMAQVGPRVIPIERSSLAKVEGLSPRTPLFGALVLELVDACANVRGLARCQHCRALFTPERRSSVYCPKCQDPRVRWKLAKQRERANLHREGLTARGARPKRPDTR